MVLSAKRIVAWSLLGFSLLFLLTGFGITEYSLTTMFAGGLFDKANSLLLHSLLWGPFLILLILHIALAHGVFGKK
ncbi:MAG: hypothetical protein LUQ17_05030 [Methanomicrobiales archaeon]|nr:hypothetical protein [Methanomicrobiales archaeon]